MAISNSSEIDIDGILASWRKDVWIGKLEVRILELYAEIIEGQLVLRH